MQSKNALSNLKNRYMAVLKKCNLINTFGALAIATMCAMPATAFSATNPAGTTIAGMDATDGSEQSGALQNVYNTNNLTNEGIISSGIAYLGDFFKVLGAEEESFVGMFGISPVDYTFSNTGEINITNVLGKNFSVGMFTETTGTSTLNNSGTITVDSTGVSSVTYGMYSIGDKMNTLTNSGTIDISTVGEQSKAAGMYSGRTGVINNTNKIAVVTDGDGSSAYGIWVESTGVSTSKNSGIIEVTTNGSVASALGMSSDRGGTHTLINTNKITVNSANYEAYAMRANNALSATLTNSGTIESTTDSGSASGMASIDVGSSTVTNIGTITANATANGSAYGMYASGTGAKVFNNYGTINASSASGSAFEAYGASNYSIGTWITTLQDWTVNDAVFGFASGASVDLSNATIVLRPKMSGDRFEFGVNYDFENFIVSSGANVDFLLSDIGTITTEVPFFQAFITGTSTANASVRVESNISDETTPGSITSSALLKTVQLQAGNASKELTQASYEDIYAKLLAQNGLSGIAAGSEANNSNDKWQIFLNPYIASMNNSKYNYDGNARGITFGASYNVSDNFSFGGHFDFNSSKFDSTLMSLDSELSSYALGLHATYKIMPQWYIIGQATGALSEMENNYALVNGMLASTDASYNSTALYLALNTGYVWDVASNENSMHSLTPEIGVNYLNMQSDDYTLDWGSAYSIYNMNYNDSNYSAFYATAKLNWRSEWLMSENSSIALLAGVGLRQKLTGDDIENDFRVLGYDYTTQVSEDDSTFLANLGFEVNKNNYTLRFTYNAEFGSEQEVHSGNVMWTYKF